MFCPECGIKLDDGVNFCPECGTNVIGLFPAKTEQESAPASETASASEERPSNKPSVASPIAAAPSVPEVETNMPTEQPAQQPQQEPQEDDIECAVHGFLFTNLDALSFSLKSDKEALRNLLNAYIQGMKQAGIGYTLVDASDYTYHDHGLFSKPKTVHLSGKNSWSDYADILFDMHKREKHAKKPLSEYVFIVGGTDIIPMPNIPHFMVGNNYDKTIDTDLLYAYPYGADMRDKLINYKLFSYDALFYIGRLPLVGGQEGAQDLVNYLQRALDNMGGIKVAAAYTQCDPNWQGVTARIIMPLDSKKLYSAIDMSQIPQDSVAFNRILLTPAIHLSSKDKNYNTVTKFNYHAQYYFFNMHGSDADNDPCYGGYALGSHENYYRGMAPVLIQNAQTPNIMFTQACYGGRFIDYPKDGSMVLSALSGNTLVFVGSSRVAYGAYDALQEGVTRIADVRISNSDILAYTFNDLMLQGYCSGAAFFAARCATFRANPGDPMHTTTVCEFNLYGDPTMHIQTGNAKTSYSKAALIKPTDKIGVVHTETIMSKSAGDRPLSLLEQVRQKVDANIMAISDSIGKHLYEQYGLPKREPFFVQRRTYADGHKDLSFTYEAGQAENAHSYFIVATDEKGNISSVDSTK